LENTIIYKCKGCGLTDSTLTYSSLPQARMARVAFALGFTVRIPLEL
jgi:hypothetical protein